MDDNSVRNLRMAELSIVKVPDINELRQEGQKALESRRTDIKVKDQIEKALASIDNQQDYELTPEKAEEIDMMINEVGSLRLRPGGIIRIDGTERFGIELIPAAWRQSRVAMMKEQLADTYRNIKRYANQLADTFERRWTELTNSLDVLENRVLFLSNILDEVGRMKDDCREVELNPVLTRALSKGNEKLPADISKHIVKEVNYFATIMKMYEMEMVRYKNSMVRYFGNAKMTDLSQLTMNIPKPLDVRVRATPDEQNQLVTMESRPLLENSVIRCTVPDPSWIKKEYKGENEAEAYCQLLTKSGYTVARIVSGSATASATVDTMTLNQMFTVLEVVREQIAFMKTMNQRFSPLDLEPDVIKDNLSIMKSHQQGEKARQYVELTSDYQYSLELFRQEVVTYLTILSSHLLTLITAHIECYDNQP